MRVSVGIPAYNQGCYLAQTLDSLLNQALPPDEIVISDNHSTDETSDILRRYEGRVRVIRPAQHLPMIAHWNYVVENLTGDWFSLLSSDDVAEQGFVQHLGRAAAAHPDAVLIRGGWLTISPAGQRTGRCRLWSTATVTEPPLTVLEQLQGPKASFAAFLCRRSAWEAVGGFPTALHLYGDWGLWLRLGAIGSFITTHEVVSRYRTGYPTNRHLERAVDAAKDEREITLNIVPSVTKQLGPTSRPLLQRASARRLTIFLAQMSDFIVDNELRRRIAIELLPVAVVTGLEGQLQAFAAGEAVSRPQRFDKLASGGSVVNAQLRTTRRQLQRLRGSR